MRVITPQEMSQVDRTAIEERGIPGLELMERAGERVAASARQMLSSSRGRRVLIWCGKGNNGGDGFVTARLLGVDGFEVRVILLGDAELLSGDAGVNYERISGFPILTKIDEAGELVGCPVLQESYDLMVDAIFGTGFRGRAEGVYREAIEAINRSDCPVLAVDIPSGVSGGTGAVEGEAVRADRTVTFAAPKLGLVQYPGADYAGELEVVDIGLPEDLLEEIPASTIYLTTAEEADSLLPERPKDINKGQCGRVLVVGGSRGMTGAAAMCARACLRAGSGLVTCAVPEALHEIMEVKLTEVITRPLPGGKDGALALEAFDIVMSWVEEFDVVALGPGLSRSEAAAELTRKLVHAIETPLVLDADGLNAMAGHAELFEAREEELVLTPHPGEMARLTGSSVDEVQEDRVGCALEAARRFKAVVILKGANTVVAEPGGRVRINTTGNPGMASAGMGDVLTGCVASLIGQGMGAFEASVAGAYFHGHAADLLAEMDAMVGMVAGDVIRYLPLAMRKG